MTSFSAAAKSHFRWRPVVPVAIAAHLLGLTGCTPAAKIEPYAVSQVITAPVEKVWYLENNFVNEDSPYELNVRVYGTEESEGWITTTEFAVVVEYTSRNWIDATDIELTLDDKRYTLTPTKRSWRTTTPSGLAHEEFKLPVDGPQILLDIQTATSGTLYVTTAAGERRKGTISAACLEAIRAFVWRYLGEHRLEPPPRDETPSSEQGVFGR